MFTLRNPEWLVLLPVLAFVGWYWRGLRLTLPLRIIFLLGIVILLARPQLLRQQEGMDLFMLVDRSASTNDKAEVSLGEWQELLNKSKRSDADELHIVNYASDVLPLATSGNQPFTGSKLRTRTSFALQNVLAMRKENRPTRILLLTDGYSTEPLSGLSERLVKENVPLDIRFLDEPVKGDFQLARFRVPGRVQAAEPFLLEIDVAGDKDGALPLQIFRDGKLLAEREIIIKRGRGHMRFTDRLAQSGARKYEARISPKSAEDAHIGNNVREAWTEVQAGPRVILLTAYDNDPVATALQAQGYDLEVVKETKKLGMGQLAGCKAVLINNVPAHAVAPEFLQALPFFVQQQGGGLLMAGGRHSFGSGGYFRSAIDPLLPVSMELKTDQRKTAVTLGIVLDRSGSMGAGVAGGMVKMDLANEGAAEAVKLLGMQDEVTVLAVDSAPHEAVGLQRIGSESNRKVIEQLCRGITVGGGGIYTYTGLKAAWSSIKHSKAGTRHIILFADAADAEEPDDYVNLLKEMTSQGASVSVIGMGTPADSDAKFLEDVAKLGNGRIFFTDKPEDIPIVFSQETVAIARSAFITDVVPSLPTGGWLELSGKSLPWLPAVDAYNLSYKQNWASQALITKDEYAAPLVAWGQRGVGRSVAISFPLGGELSEGIRKWDQYGNLVQTLTRWLMGDPTPPGLGLRHRLDGTNLELNLLHDDTWNDPFTAEPPRIVLADPLNAEGTRELTWEKLMPGHYQLHQDLDEGELVRGVIKAGKHTIPFGPISVGTGLEWAFDPDRIEELLTVSELSGGRQLLSLADAWLSPAVVNWTDLRLPILLLVLAAMLADALVSRMGWRMPEWGFAWIKGQQSTLAKPAPTTTMAKPAAAPSMGPSAMPVPVATSEPSQPAAPEVDAAAAAEEKRRQRYARAKRD